MYQTMIVQCISWWDGEQFCEQQFFILTTCVHGSFVRLGCTAFFSWFIAWMVTHISALLGLWSRREVAELFFRVIPLGKFHLQLLRKPNREKQCLSRHPGCRFHPQKQPSADSLPSPMSGASQPALSINICGSMHVVLLGLFTRTLVLFPDPIFRPCTRAWERG